MSLTAEGVLIVVGALFILIGILGGGFEASVIKIPQTGKLQRVVSFGVGSALMIAGMVFLLMNQSGNGAAPAQDATEKSQPAAAAPQPAANDSDAAAPAQDTEKPEPAEAAPQPKPEADDEKSQ